MYQRCIQSASLHSGMHLFFFGHTECRTKGPTGYRKKKKKRMFMQITNAISPYGEMIEFLKFQGKLLFFLDFLVKRFHFANNYLYVQLEEFEILRVA